MPFARKINSKRSTTFRKAPAISPEKLVLRALAMKKVSIPLLRKAVLEREHQIHREHPHLTKVIVHQKASREVMQIIEKHVKK
ncbi:MAG: hypothetical protein AABW59_00180 [archaeon]